MDVEHRRIVEERTIRPAEPSGAIFIRDIAISPDGRNVGYIYGRNLGYLYQLRGLVPPAR